MDKLPIFEAIYLPEAKDKVIIESLSLVDAPAIMANFLYFNEDIVKMNFSNDEQMIIKGPALIPNELIFRKGDKTFPDRNIYFSAETIKQVAASFLSKNGQKINLNHSNKFIDTNIIESYFETNEKNEFDVPIGSWIVSLKINDKNVWNDIKSGKYKGFSIQGVFSQQLEEKFNKELKLEDNMTLKEKLIKAINDILFDEDSEDEVVPTGETSEEFAEEVKPEEKPIEEVKPEEAPVVDVTGETKPEEAPVVEEPKKDEVTIESVSDLIAKSQQETIDKLTKMIEDLNKKLEAYGNTPVDESKKTTEINNLPTTFTNPATRFVSRK